MGSRVFGDHIRVNDDFRSRGELDVGRRLESGRGIRKLQRVAGGVARIRDALESVRRANGDTTYDHPLCVKGPRPDPEVRVFDVQEVVRTVGRHLLLREVFSCKVGCTLEERFRIYGLGYLSFISLILLFQTSRPW